MLPKDLNCLTFVWQTNWCRRRSQNVLATVLHRLRTSVRWLTVIGQFCVVLTHITAAALLPGVLVMISTTAGRRHVQRFESRRIAEYRLILIWSRRHIHHWMRRRWRQRGRRTQRHVMMRRVSLGLRHVLKNRLKFVFDSIQSNNYGHAKAKLVYG